MFTKVKMFYSENREIINTMAIVIAATVIGQIMVSATAIGMDQLAKHINGSEQTNNDVMVVDQTPTAE